MSKYDDYNLPDEYLADQMTSDQYAKAARLAREQKSSSFSNGGVRKFEMPEIDQAFEEDLKASSDSFRQSVLDIPEGNQLGNSEETDSSFDTSFLDDNLSNSSSNQYNLEDLDDLEGEGLADNSYNRRMTRANRSLSRPASKRKTSTNKNCKNMLTNLKQMLSLMFSKRPMQVFHLDLDWGSLGILALLNLILVAAFNNVIYSKYFADVLERITGGSSGGKVFGFSLLSQLATFVLLFIILLVMAFVLKSAARKPKQYVQTIILSSVPYTISLFVSVIVASFFPIGGLILAIAGKIHTYIYFYAGFQKGHPTKKNSPFWIFLLALVLILTLQVFFVSLI